ncbi:NAD(P)/FAD-dependent oxidoreductase [Psychromicrobium xiongbiense]|uniref:NAD(P)/FAD-dependent oxidoreductase n=1 Tax=Psychromicrobium xiongbiense TaxID=3051184 RepID=UPI002554E45D|nr:FAD-dependent oxidoreductase [Psychromicrobium sp. YIM S02556]
MSKETLPGQTSATPEVTTEHERAMVILGAGLAGATAAATLREEGYTGAVILVGAEAQIPYLRPPLSKGYLAGKDSEESLWPYLPAWYEQNQVEVVTDDDATVFNPVAHTVSLRSGRTLHYHRLLLATGARPRRLRFPGSDLPGVHTFRTKDDSQRLRGELASGERRLVILGSGWIGMEIAATATELGHQVTVISHSEVPLSAAIGPELGAFFTDRQREAGVQFLMPSGIASITDDAGSQLSVHTTTGESLPADLVVIAVGVLPNTELAQAAGLETDHGILVDARLRTSTPDVFAAGDVANALHPMVGAHLRSEHWANALASGAVAARSMLGRVAVLNDIPYFYTDQFDLGMEYSGFGTLTEGLTPVIRGSLELREFLAFWLREGRVVAGMNVNIWDVQEEIKDLILSKRVVEAARLADPQIPLGEA